MLIGVEIWCQAQRLQAVAKDFCDYLVQGWTQGNGPIIHYFLGVFGLRYHSNVGLIVTLVYRNLGEEQSSIIAHFITNDIPKRLEEVGGETVMPRGFVSMYRKYCLLYLLVIWYLDEPQICFLRDLRRDSFLHNLIIAWSCGQKSFL